MQEPDTGLVLHRIYPGYTMEFDPSAMRSVLRLGGLLDGQFEQVVRSAHNVGLLELEIVSRHPPLWRVHRAPSGAGRSVEQVHEMVERFIKWVQDKPRTSKTWMMLTRIDDCPLTEDWTPTQVAGLVYYLEYKGAVSFSTSEGGVYTVSAAA